MVMSLHREYTGFPIIPRLRPTLPKNKALDIIFGPKIGLGHYQKCFHMKILVPGRLAELVHFFDRVGLVCDVSITLEPNLRF